MICDLPSVSVRRVERAIRDRAYIDREHGMLLDSFHGAEPEMQATEELLGFDG